ncbi:MAG: DNA polymerase IV [Candidatus Omnitrophica bacterium]|nr:DNA polymerase IV [Candidatus Omnitrophota bacterium]
MNKPRCIIHMDMDAFFAAVEQRDNPRLKGKPVVIGADPKGGEGRGVVSTCSYEARKYGIHSAMPISIAYRKCPGAVFLPPDMQKYNRESDKIFGILGTFTPDILPISVDEAFMDITGSYKLFAKTPLETCVLIKRAIKQNTGLTASLGMAPVMMAAKIASDLDKPDGLVVVSEDHLTDFLHELPVGKLWGIGKVSKKAFNNIGIKTVGDLASFREKDIVDIFGENGRHVWQLANGIDPRPVEAGDSVSSVSNEHTFEKDCEDRNTVLDTLMYLSEKVSRRLRKKGLSGRTVTLKIRTPDFRTCTRAETLDFPTNFTEDIYSAASAKIVEFNPSGRNSIRLIGVKVSNFSESPWQSDLFDMTVEKKVKKENLYRAIDRIKDRFGEKAIRRR